MSPSDGGQRRGRPRRGGRRVGPGRGAAEGDDGGGVDGDGGAVPARRALVGGGRLEVSGEARGGERVAGEVAVERDLDEGLLRRGRHAVRERA